MRLLRTPLAVLAVGFLSGCASPASPPADAPPPAPATAKPQPDGFGRHHHPIQTANPEAQRLFDVGMAQAFGFNHEAAIRSFERASALDPAAAMPHWGRAWALGPNYNLDIDDARAKAADEAISKAAVLAEKGPEEERAYIAALRVRYSPDMKANRAALAQKYSAAMDALAKRYPNDLDAATLHAESLMNLTPWKLWTLDGKPAENTGRLVGILESVLARNPNHLGANHYYIHAVEASRDAARGMPSAARLEALAESSGHLLHMPAHIYARVGDHAKAAAANAAGAAADRKYLVSAPPDGFYGMAYYSHNLHFLADSHMMQGRFGDAQQAAARVAEHVGPHAEMMPMAESMMVMPVNLLMRFARYTDILALPAPPPNRPVQLSWHHFARGVALSKTGRIEQAVDARKALTAALATVPDTAAFGGSGLIDARSVLNIAGFVLDARIASARKDHARAVKLWQSAISAADLLPYDEPPVWFYPMRESLGAELLANDMPAEAARVFEEDLARHPKNARSLFGLQAALDRQGATDSAAQAQKEFQAAWKNADAKLTLAEF